MPSGEAASQVPLTPGAGRAYHGGMKHFPEAHQRVAPDRTIALILAGIVLVMAIIMVVVSLAD
jgi:hypothetical protein